MCHMRLISAGPVLVCDYVTHRVYSVDILKQCCRAGSGISRPVQKSQINYACFLIFYIFNSELQYIRHTIL
jgi:hypothetical protein